MWGDLQLWSVHRRPSGKLSCAILLIGGKTGPAKGILTAGLQTQSYCGLRHHTTRKTIGTCCSSYQIEFDLAPESKETRRVVSRSKRKSQVEAGRKTCTEEQLSEAVDDLDLLMQVGAHVADPAFYGVLKRSIAQKDLVLGRRIHSLVVRGGYGSNTFLANHIICMYASHRMLEEALQVFKSVPVPNCYMWASIIMAYARHGQPMQAIKLYRQMRGSTMKPDNHIYVAVLKACTKAEDLACGREIHADILEDADEPNMHVLNCLVDMYAKCGSLEDARRVFNHLPTKDVVTWTAMIAGYSQHGLGQEALTLYARMQQEGIILADAVTFVCLLQACGSLAGLEKGKEIHAHVTKLGPKGTDIFVSNALIDMYCKCGSMVDAQGVFDGLATKDIVTWSALIGGYACQGESERVFDLLHRMRQDGLQPNEITFLSVLTVCSSAGLVDKGQMSFESMTRDYGILPTMEHYICMVDLLGRAGQVDKAMEMVKTMPFQPSGGVWRCVLAACQKWNIVDLGREAFEHVLKLDIHY